MNVMKLAIPLFVALAYSPCQGLAAPILDPALASFAVLGATGVTNVPVTNIGGNLGSAPNSSVGGGYIFTSGSLQQNTPLAQQAQLDLDEAITDLSAFGAGINLGSSLSGTIGPGIYTVTASTSPNVAGALVLNGGGSNSAVWVFQMPSTLITSATSTVSVTNVGDGAHVGIYWNVGSAATLNGYTFVGNVLAETLISSDGNLTMGCGRLLSDTAQVTLHQDNISIGCTGFAALSGGFDQGVNIGSGGTGGSGGQIVAGIPEPEIYAMMAAGLGLMGFVARRRKQ